MLYRTTRTAVLITGLAAAVQLSSMSTAHAVPRGCLPGSVKSILNQIESRFGRVQVISSFRKGARIAGSGRRSYHASCRAVDFHPPKGKYAAVVAYLKRNFKGGIGTYRCRMRHIHIDNGPKVRWSKCQ